MNAKAMIDRALDGMLEAYQKDAPETKDCTDACKLNKTYSKDDDVCRKCYAAGKMQEKLFEMAINVGRPSVIQACLEAMLDRDEDEDEGNGEVN